MQGRSIVRKTSIRFCLWAKLTSKTSIRFCSGLALQFGRLGLALTDARPCSSARNAALWHGFTMQNIVSQVRTPLLSAQGGRTEHSSTINTNQKKDWENPQIYQRNRLGSHVPLISHTRNSQALSRFSGIAEQSDWTNVRVLSGKEWRFNLFEMPESVPSDFHEPSYDTSQWSKVRCHC